MSTSHAAPALSSTEGSSASGRPPEVHPVLGIAVGTTQAELAVLVYSRFSKSAKRAVPHRFIVLDTLPYDDLIERLSSGGWTRDQVQAAIPRSHYLELPSPFTGKFDFQNPMNASWRETIFDPSLERIARQPNAPGSGGTPAIARARTEGNADVIRRFLTQHKQELLRIRDETLALLPGIRVVEFGTFRGGTATGASLLVGGLVREVCSEPQTEIHLRVVMPCVYDAADDRAAAQAFAQLQEVALCHRYGNRVPFRGGDLPAPFDSVSPVFLTNGAVALKPHDALMQEAAIFGSQLRVASQSAYNARFVDLSDVVGHDLEGEPTHVRLATAVSVGVVRPGTLEYLVLSALHHHMDGIVLQAETWDRTRTLSVVETTRLNDALAAIVRDLGLDLQSLLGRIDGNPAPIQALRSSFEQIANKVAVMDAVAVKAQVNALPELIKRAFEPLEKGWEERVRQLVATLPDRILEAINSRLGDAPAVAQAALGRLADHLTGIADAVTRKAADHEKARAFHGGTFQTTLADVQQAGTGIFSSVWMNKDEVTRDAARPALDAGLLASLARAEQTRHLALARALRGPLSITDAQGRSVPLAAVVESLTAIGLNAAAQLRGRLDEMLKALRAAQESHGQIVDKFGSAVFNRTLLFDGVDTTGLDVTAKALSPKLAAVPDAVLFVRAALDFRLTSPVSRAELDELVRVLLPHVPAFGDTVRTLAETLEAEPSRCDLVVQLLRNAKTPFATTNREALDQQGLLNASRRDHILLIEVPGGKDGFVGKLLLQQSIVNDPKQLVGSDDGDIHMMWLRDGLPYGVLQPLSEYRNRHARYQSSPTVPAYTRRWSQLPTLDAPRTNLVQAISRTLYLLPALAPTHLTAAPTGGLDLKFERLNTYNMPVPDTTHADNFDDLVRWVARDPAVRRYLDGLVKAALVADPKAYDATLLAAWKQATGPAKAHLEDALNQRGVNPHI